MDNILLSIVIPCRNEEKFIGKCLDSIIANEFPKESMEVLVVDGMSDDNTRAVIEKYSDNFFFIKLLGNPKKVTPAALNLGIKSAQGKYIMILSGHSKIDQYFIKANMDAFQKYSADCIGGILVTLPAEETLVPQAIAIALSHPFGVGNSYFRIGSNKAKYVDTVPFGCYRKEVFNKVGFFDEDLIRNQDDEFNLRLLKNGGKVLIVPDIISYYYARGSLSKLWKMYFQYGLFKPLVSKKVGKIMTWRQIIPALFVSSLVASLTLSLLMSQFIGLFALIMMSYLSANMFFSLSLSVKKGFKYFLVLPIVFPILHVSYGWGYLKGVKDYFVFKKNNKNNEGIPLTR
ncbi:MAG: glycosyltransferase family 2 protein [Nitrospirota bacterium]